MIDRRPPVLTVTLAVLALGLAASAVPGLSFQSGAGALERAWALLAEAEELCRALPGPASAHGRAPRSQDRAPSARRQVAREALQIVRELAQSAFEPSLSIPILRTERRVHRSCLAAEARSGFVGGSRRSLDGRESRDRVELLKPFLARLNTAVGGDSDAVSERAEVAPVDRVADPVPAPSVLQPEPQPQPEPAEVAHTAAATMLEEPARTAGAETGLESSKIAIEPASSKYRQRLRRWLSMFEREAGALRAGRRRLQIEIDRRSMAQARAECRRFGLVLARIDAKLLDAAPSRGLSSRVEKMVEQYWRAVGLCATGRPAAAFAYLNEGDREWAIIAQIAARMREPRQFKPLEPAGPAPAD